MKACLLTSLSRLACLLLGAAGLAACTRPPAASTSSEAPKSCESRYPAATFSQYTTRQLGREYRRLRHAKCRRSSYGGDFYQLLKVLGNRLNGQPRAAVRRIMGQPDRVRDSTLVYYWRGEHDYLRFCLEADGTVKSAWYMALE